MGQNRKSSTGITYTGQFSNVISKSFQEYKDLLN